MGRRVDHGYLDLFRREQDRHGAADCRKRLVGLVPGDQHPLAKARDVDAVVGWHISPVRVRLAQVPDAPLAGARFRAVELARERLLSAV